MTHTLAAVFDNRRDAEQARDAVLAGGFRDLVVQLSQADADSSAGSTAPPASSAEPSRDDGSIGSSIKRFFSNLFGDDEDTETYTEAVNRGHHVLTVQAGSLEEMERAADIIEAYGPFDIDERKNEWSSAGWSGGRMAGAGATGGQYLGAQQSAQGGTSSSMGAPGTGGTLDLGGSTGLGATAAVGGATDLGATPTIGGMSGVGSTASMGSTSSMESGSGLGNASGVGAGSLQGQAGGASQQFADTGGQAIPGGQAGQTAGRRGVQRGGVRIYQRVTETPLTENLSLREEQLLVQPLRADDLVDRDDDYYRNHWTSNYAGTGGTYDEYAPAYRYGSSMAGADSNRGRSWDEAEPALRSSWESQYPQSAWDKFKAAVRHGWDRLTS